MKKKILSILLSVTLITTLAVGCSPKADNKDTTPADTNAASDSSKEYEGIPISDANIELTVWESTGGADQFIMQAGEAFTAKFPNITIKYVNVELADSPGQIALDGPGGVGPDIFATPSDAIGTLVESGHLLPSQQQDYIKTQALDSCVVAVTLGGEMYGYPISADTYALFYNRDLISDEEVPTTFAELEEWCKEFQAANSNKQGFLMNVAEVYYTYIFTTMNGNRIFGPNGDDETASNMNNEEAVAGMKYFQSLRGILDVPAADITSAYCDGAFQSGDVAMYLTGLWNVANFRDAGVDFGVAAIPALPGTDTPPASLSNARNMVVSAYSDYPNEAAAFGLFMMSEEMQQLRFEITGALPSISIELEEDYVKGFLEQLDYAFPIPSTVKMNNFWETMNSASANIWDGADVQAELDAADRVIMAE